ncbi:MAG: hypothetical protein LBV74_03205 [Tannerella sp.]|jgi:hypothetical protein|nr:hypothetical protein [Tannerella sp.]
MFANTIGTEYNEKDLPVVLMDTLFNISSVILDRADVAEANEITRMEVSYNENNMLEVITEYRPEKQTEGDNDWGYSYKFRYAYDEKGNTASMVGIDENGSGNETYYENVYLLGGNSNDPVTDISPKVKIIFANGQLNITSEEGAPLDIAIYSIQETLVAQQRGSQEINREP